MNTPTADSSRPALLTLSILWLSHFFVDALIGIWPVYKSIAQVDLAKAGLIAAGGAFIGEGSQLFFGSLSDSGLRNRCIIFGIFLTLFSILLSYTNHPLLLFLFFMLTCLGSGSFHPSASSLSGGLRVNHRTIYLTIFASGGSLGLALSQIIFTSSYNFTKGNIIWLFLPPILLLIFSAYFVLPKQKPSIQEKKSNFKDYIFFFKSPILRSLYLSQVANQSIFWGAIFILPDVLISFNQPKSVCYGIGHFCLIFGGTLMLVPAGYLAEKYSARKLMLYLAAIGCVCLYCILLFGQYLSFALLPILFILGGCLATANPIAVSFGIKLFPNHSGAISAFLMGLVWCIAECIGPGGVGLLTTLFSEKAPIKALAVLGLLFFLQIYHLLLLPKEEPSFRLTPLAHE